MMTIQETGRATFQVTSHGQDYTVDLLWFRGNGRCDCLHFSTRVKPEIEQLIEAGRFVPGPATTCPHIEAADRVLLQKFKKELIRQFPDSERDGA